MKNPARLALAISLALSAAAAQSAPLAKGNILAANGIPKGEAPASSLPALKAALNGGWGLAANVTLTKDGRMYLVAAGTVSRILKGGDASKLTPEEMRGVNLNQREGDLDFGDDEVVDYHSPVELEKVAPLIPKAGTVFLHFSNVPGSTEAVAAMVKKRFSEVFKEGTPTNLVVVSNRGNLLIDLGREMPGLKRFHYVVPRGHNKVKGDFLVEAPSVIYAAQGYKADGIMVEYIAGHITPAYVDKLKKAGFEVVLGAVGCGAMPSADAVAASASEYALAKDPAALYKALGGK